MSETDQRIGCDDRLVFFAAVFLGVVLLLTGFFVALAGCLAERSLATF